MHSPRIKQGVFVLEGLNAVATTFYFYYIYFFTAEVLGFTQLENLLLAAAVGFVYMLCSVHGGRFAQRRGGFAALKRGFVILATALLVGSQVRSAALHVALLAVATLGMSFTWPSLEALASEGASPARLPHVVGLYNVVWAVAGAVAYFAAGPLIQIGGWTALFLVPATLHLAQLALTLTLTRARPELLTTAGGGEPGLPPLHREPDARRSPVSPQTFLRMAWLANPFAYLALNTVVAVSPNLAQTLNLSAREAGFYLSIWMFARAAAFVLFWFWTGWHYRFRWLAAAYGLLVAGLVGILLSSNLGLLIALQLAFGLAVGLIYYSSLFYSMDVGETKGEHGGWHEAMIGAGCCAGPATGAAALYFFPAHPHSSAWGVASLLLVGLAGLAHLRWKGSAGSR